MPDMIGVELAKVGDWDTSTGKWSPTAADFAAAVTAASDPGVATPVVKIGHTDPRFDGEPALGSIRNLRVSADGDTLIGDLLNLPSWLHESMATCWPSRSVEASLGVEMPDGKKYPLVIDAVALLGVVPPAVKGLADLPALVAASRRVGRLPAARKVAASMTTDPMPYVTPLVEKIAAAHNVNLRTVRGSGIGGRIRKSDVEKAAGIAPAPTVSAAQAGVDAELAQLQRDLAPFSRNAQVSAAHRGDPAYARNPLVDAARREAPQRVAAAAGKATEPRLFGSSDLPPFTASGIDPNLLLDVPWDARHALAEAPTNAAAYAIMQDPGSADLDAPHPANLDYQRRVQAWVAEGVSEAEMEEAFMQAFPWMAQERDRQERLVEAKKREEEDKQLAAVRAARAGGALGLDGHHTRSGSI